MSQHNDEGVRRRRHSDVATLNRSWLIPTQLAKRTSPSVAETTLFEAGADGSSPVVVFTNARLSPSGGQARSRVDTVFVPGGDSHGGAARDLSPGGTPHSSDHSGHHSPVITVVIPSEGNVRGHAPPPTDKEVVTATLAAHRHQARATSPTQTRQPNFPICDRSPQAARALMVRNRVSSHSSVPSMRPPTNFYAERPAMW